MSAPSPKAPTSASEHSDDDSLRRLVEGVLDYAVYMLDPKGNVASWNSGAERFKGYTAAEIVGSHFSRFYDEEGRRSGLPARALEVAFLGTCRHGSDPRTRGCRWRPASATTRYGRSSRGPARSTRS